MSIVRIGLAETKHFAKGYESIFGKPKKDSGDGKKASQTKKNSGKKAAKAQKKKGKG